MDERAKNGPLARHYREENDINQITWQVQSLQEIWDATKYFKQLEHDIIMEGRGSYGSNYHLYVYDPDDQINEFFFGMEQIGWEGHARPPAMHHAMREAAEGPHVGEFEELQADLAAGIDPASGYRYEDPLPHKYNVDGMLLTRPFKITKIGPVKLFADNAELTMEYYRDTLGFELSETVEWQGGKCYFLRCDREHHSVGIFPRVWRDKLGLSSATSNMSFGLQVANYQQLRDAVDFLRENGVRVETDIVPPELHPGIDYAAYAFDPDGHCLELYYYMEQVGWDGQVRLQSQRRHVDPHNWPQALEALPDTYSGEVMLGTWA
jgi:catechol 2,3-dioxygenase-like lactoylglutathione lyase family enzyme